MKRIISGFGITGGNFFDNGIFTGVNLFEILKHYPLSNDAKEIVFEGTDKGYDMLTQRVSKKKVNYARSFNIEELKNYEPILCFEMNGAPINSDHGGPLRLIIPGIYGAEHVKWLGRIIAIPNKFDGYYQNEYYRYKIDGEIVPVHEQRPKSMVIKVLKRQERITAYGVAWRGLSPIVKVEVSIDDTQTWQPAELLCGEIDNSWIFWQYQLPQDLKGQVKIIPRAFTENGNCQPLKPGKYSTIYGNNSVISAVVNI
jgi:DMSO/TMAO reductase YedYZ molybdopterin-dependent catalytic subunit